MAKAGGYGPFGSTPQMNRGPEVPGARPLFHSVRDIALIIDKTLGPGYGVLNAGTILAKNVSASGNKNKMVPYVLDDSSLNNQTGVAYLVSSYGTGTTDIYVTIEDSYRFIVGDDIVLGRNNSGSWETHNGGAITAIDRTTHEHMAKISFTTSKSSADFTTANLAGCWVECGTGDKLCTAAYILDQDVDTGKGEDAAGGLTSVVLNNAVLNLWVMQLENYDSQAATDLSASEDGNFLILK